MAQSFAAHGARVIVGGLDGDAAAAAAVDWARGWTGDCPPLRCHGAG
jgi:NAD(P)-dependent dehydrogenase (short-subunit alcohol dehydrogenase family)